jgi:quinolinate synthase
MRDLTEETRIPRDTRKATQTTSTSTSTSTSTNLIVTEMALLHHLEIAHPTESTKEADHLLGIVAMRRTLRGDTIVRSLQSEEKRGDEDDPQVR